MCTSHVLIIDRIWESASMIRCVSGHSEPLSLYLVFFIFSPGGERAPLDFKMRCLSLT